MSPYKLSKKCWLVQSTRCGVKLQNPVQNGRGVHNSHLSSHECTPELTKGPLLPCFRYVTIQVLLATSVNGTPLPPGWLVLAAG
jgi:hypothetical protein